MISRRWSRVARVRVRAARDRSALAACGSEHAAPTPIRFLHTFGADETELFNATMAERGHRGRVVARAVRARPAGDQRDPARRHDLPRPDPHRRDVAARASSRPSCSHRCPPSSRSSTGCPRPPRSREPIDVVAALPQTVDGLARRPRRGRARAGEPVDRRPASPPRRAAQHRRPPAPARRCASMATGSCRGCAPSGADLAAGAIDERGAARALARFAALFGDARRRRRRPPGGEAPDELRRWTRARDRVLGHRAVAGRRAARSRAPRACRRSRTRRAAASCSSCRRARSGPPKAGGSRAS